jgi:hypothetical protein
MFFHKYHLFHRKCLVRLTRLFRLPAGAFAVFSFGGGIGRVHGR